MPRRKIYSRKILITGATEGIGYELAKNYASRGHQILATGSRRVVVDSAHFNSPDISYVRADQSDPGHAAIAIAEAMVRLEWDGLDLAILNAGTGWAGLPQEETAESIERQITINLTGPVQIARAIAPLLFSTAGKLVLIGSTAAKGHPNFATYAASKAGLDAFSRSLREEWRGRAQVQMIHPGPTRTAMHEKAGLKKGVAHRFFMPVRRAALAIERSIRSNEKRREIGRSYGMGAMLSRAGKGEL